MSRCIFEGSHISFFQPSSCALRPVGSLTFRRRVARLDAESTKQDKNRPNTKSRRLLQGSHSGKMLGFFQRSVFDWVGVKRIAQKDTLRSRLAFHAPLSFPKNPCCLVSGPACFSSPLRKSPRQDMPLSKSSVLHNDKAPQQGD
jgi:hypothetical protein